MIISHKYKFIFVKTRKTASTSIEVALSKLCAPEDIITPINPKAEGHLPRNYDGFFNHIPLKKIKSIISPELYKTYYKFTFERNPWDKMVSYYWYCTKRWGVTENFREFCLKCKKENSGNYTIPSDIERYSINGKIDVDFIGRYESLEEDFNQICNTLGIPFNGHLTKEKSDFRKEKRQYSSYYDSITKKKIEQEFKKEIETFGYSFETSDC